LEGIGNWTRSQVLFIDALRAQVSRKIAGFV
jgi:hypothetical protein